MVTSSFRETFRDEATKTVTSSILSVSPEFSSIFRNACNKNALSFKLFFLLHDNWTKHILRNPLRLFLNPDLMAKTQALAAICIKINANFLKPFFRKNHILNFKIEVKILSLIWLQRRWDKILLTLAGGLCEDHLVLICKIQPFFYF